MIVIGGDADGEAIGGADGGVDGAGRADEADNTGDAGADREWPAVGAGTGAGSSAGAGPATPDNGGGMTGVEAGRSEPGGHGDAPDSSPTIPLGACLAPDGSTAGAVALDVGRAHAGVVVGKRGAGKSYTLGVLAEGLASTAGTTAIVVDPMGAFASLADGVDGARRVDRPTVRASAVPPPAWPAMLDLAPTGGAGGLVWRTAAERETLDGMLAAVADADAGRDAVRAARNHLRQAAGWDVFDPDGLVADDLLGAVATVLDCRGLAAPAANAVVRAVARACYERCVRRSVQRLPWLLVDEAHAFFDGVAAAALETLYTRGRAPGVSVVAATQRPSALPGYAVSQSDLVVAHRLTDRAERDALERARPAYLADGLAATLPDTPGHATVLDDRSEAVHRVAVRERSTDHDGGAARVGGRAPTGAADGSDPG